MEPTNTLRHKLSKAQVYAAFLKLLKNQAYYPVFSTKEKDHVYLEVSTYDMQLVHVLESVLSPYLSICLQPHFGFRVLLDEPTSVKYVTFTVTV